MIATEKDTKDTIQKLDLSSLPEKGNVVIHYNRDEPLVYDATKIKGDIPKRPLYILISGAVGAVVGYVGTKIYVNQKMFAFETEVLGQTKSNILGRSGLATAVTEVGLSGGGLAAGLASGQIHMSNASDLALSGKHGRLPKFIYSALDGPGGKSIIALGGALAVGAVAAAVAYSVTPPDAKKPESDATKGNDWKDKVAADKDTPRVVS